MAGYDHGLFEPVRKLPGVSLAQSSGLPFFGIKKDGPRLGIHGVHADGIVRTAHHPAKVTPFTTMGKNLSFHFFRVEFDAVRFGAVHDTKPAPFFRDTFIVMNISYVIHAEWLLPVS
ncbi:hypothetical protein J2S31_000577 [Nitrospina gracilis Nb-211]|nr:hypothetical protein [Nitrospina gracilis Nb-211]